MIKQVVKRNTVSKSKNDCKPMRSPLFYVGDKYKLMPQLTSLFPRDINTYYDVFCGGGSASINVKAKKYVMNDIDSKVLDLHRYLINESKDIEALIKRMNEEILKYGLSLSSLGSNSKIEELKKIYKKTYFSVYNKSSYHKLRDDYNNNKDRIDLLYLLIIYGFNHMIRFNKSGQFNLPVGNVDWNNNVNKALHDYSNWSKNNIELTSGLDFELFLANNNYQEQDFIYCDPPYLITFSDYNKLWDEQEELRLYKVLDRLNNQGIRWGVSNMLAHKGRINQILDEWSKQYSVFEIDSNYISYFDNTVKISSREIYVTNI